MPKLSVCIIGKNEERYLEECLKHLKQYDVEIVFTDTGSTDATVEIACKYADKVLTFAWCKDFSKARNYCAEYASCEYVLALDCDEFIEMLDLEDVLQHLQEDDSQIGTLRLDNVVIREDGSQGETSTIVPRLYNRNIYHFHGAIHEQIQRRENFSGISEHQKWFNIKAEVKHWGYAISQEEMFKKQRRNLELLYNVEQMGKADAYTYFQIAQSEFITGNKERAVDYYYKSLERNEDISFQYVQYTIINLAIALSHTGHVEEAVRLMERYRGKIVTARYLYSYAMILLDKGQRIQALTYFLQTVMAIDKDLLGEELRTCYEMIIDLYVSMGKPEMAAPFSKIMNNL